MIGSARINVTNTPTPLVLAPGAVDYREGFSLLIRNKSTSPVDIGRSDVIAGSGFELGPSEDISFDLETNEVVYAIAATAGPYRLDILFQGV